MTQASLIAVVDDDKATRETVADYLKLHGFEVSALSGGMALRESLAKRRPDLIVLDLNMPEEDGLSIIRSLKEKAVSVPIIMLTATASPIDRIVGLELGADDYITKPFDPRELIARVKNLLRRVAEGRAARIVPEQVVHFGGCSLDVSARRFFAADGAEIALTKAEFDLLKAFAAAPGIVLSRDRLMQATTHRDLTAEDRTIDVLVGRLRRKLAALPARPATITTVHGEGYLFTPERT